MILYMFLVYFFFNRAGQTHWIFHFHLIQSQFSSLILIVLTSVFLSDFIAFEEETSLVLRIFSARLVYLPFFPAGIDCF